MRILNRRQLAKIPMADASNLYLGEFDESSRSVAQKQDRAYANRQARAKQRAIARQKYEEAQNAVASAEYTAMLKRSLKQDTSKYSQAMSGRSDFGFVPKFGNHTPLMGFVDSMPTTLKDFSQREVYPAQDFCNTKTSHDFVGYTKMKDFPLVEDANSDFGGILTTDSKSADFSEYIVNDAKHDFGYAPRRRRRK